MDRINLTNPVNWKHPLNKGRVSWWFVPRESGRQAGATINSVSGTTGRIYDLCRRGNGTIANGASNIPAWCQNSRGDPALRWLSGGAVDGHIDVGGGTIYDFTDNFTVGCTFNTSTVTTANSGLGGFMSKYQSPASNAWTFRRHDDYVEFGGSTMATSAAGSVVVNTEYRCVAVMQAGIATIYLNGAVNGTPAAVSITSTPGDSLLIGEAYDPGGFNFAGTMNDWFVSSRPWSSGEVALDYRLSRKSYRGPNSPLRFLPRPFYVSENVQTVSLTSEAYASEMMQFASPASFTASLEATASAGGFGPLVPTGTPEFLAEAIASNVVEGGIPTLVSLESLAIASETLVAGDPVSLESIAYAHNTMRSIPNGNRKILASKIYKR